MPPWLLAQLLNVVVVCGQNDIKILTLYIHKIAKIFDKNMENRQNL
jgi:hypothetical protein